MEIKSYISLFSLLLFFFQMSMFKSVLYVEMVLKLQVITAKDEYVNKAC